MYDLTTQVMLRRQEYTTSGDDELSTEEETEGDLTLTPTERVADLCHKRAFSSFEHKTISTVAAEVLGRLPPKIGAKDAHPALSAFLKKREQTSLADTARVATYALCKFIDAFAILTSQ